MTNRVWFAHPSITFNRRGNPTKTRITLAFTEESDGRIFAGVSFCSPKDNFNRKIGRRIAAGRLKAAPIDLGQAQTDHDANHLVAKAISQLKASDMFPTTWSSVATTPRSNTTGGPLAILSAAVAARF